ncbi:hypothetical protein KR044_001730, partial [Drosophila immigrans]
QKPKLVYDPSDNYISRVARTSLPATASPAPTATAAAIATAQPTSPTQQQTSLTSSAAELQQRNFDTCSKCTKSEPKRGSGYKSNFLACKTCALKWHFNCLPVAFEILSNARKRYKCEKCRRCRVCSNAKQGDKQPEREREMERQLMCCCMCANVYHLDCHWPRVATSMLHDASWKCYSCDPSYNEPQVLEAAADASAAGDVAPIATQASSTAPSSLSSSSPPTRKSKVGRKKRATSDPAPAPAKKLNMAKPEQETAESLVELQQLDDADETAATNSPMPQPDAALASTSTSSPPPAIDLSAAPDEDEEAPADEQNGDGDGDDDGDCTEVVDEEQQAVTVQSWNVEQVVSYVERFYPQESNVFKSQEIDGAALMVLTRQDIIDRFGLKLGPSLRIYQLVLSLQTALDDVTLGWVE